MRYVLDSLRPGVTVAFSYGGSAGADQVVLGADSVSVSYGAGVLTFRTSAQLPSMTLLPDTTYVARLVAGKVEVARIV